MKRVGSGPVLSDQTCTCSSQIHFQAIDGMDAVYLALRAGVMGAYLSFVEPAVDELAFTRLGAVPLVRDPLHCPVAVRVQCVHGRPVTRGREGARREEAQTHPGEPRTPSKACVNVI